MTLIRPGALILLLAVSACQEAKQPWTLPYGQWKFAFFTPHALPALVTHVRIIDTANALYRFNTLDGIHGSTVTVGQWSDRVMRGSIHFNKANFPPRYMLFCWDSIIDKKVYQTSLFFPQEVWQKMMTPADYKDIFGETVWFQTMLFGLAPGGKVRVWLQDNGGRPNYPVPVINLTTVSGDQMDVCQGITQSDFSYGYDQDIKEFIQGKTYPYGSW